MKILLVNPPIREWAKPNVLPLGLGYIASVLRDKGHEVDMMDINAYRWDISEVEDRVKNTEFDVVGIGAIVTVYKYVKWLAGIFKKYHPDRKIVIGGSVGTSIPRIILEKTEADIVCIGEGELTIIDLIEALKNGKDIAGVDGIWFKGDDREIHINKNRAPIKDLDALPLPAWDLFPMEIYLKNPVGAPNRNKWIDGGSDSEVPISMNLNGTRGCPYQCIYCYHDFMGSGYRHRSAGNIVNEMKVLHEQYRVKYFHFTDDEFCLKKVFSMISAERSKANLKTKLPGDALEGLI